MKRFVFFTLVSLFTINAFGQNNKQEVFKNQPGNSEEGYTPGISDSIYLLSIPELTLPGNLKKAVIPSVVDNSILPYLRPVFVQEGASCGQAAGIGYNFTYEMDQARNLPADTSINQYPTHFVYNFENIGYPYFGVSYFTSFEILKKCGTMNVKDYGGFFDNGNRWISGYDMYYNGMHNRIEDVYNIKTNTPQGILTLKNWVYNHLGESATGGVGSFYVGYWNTHFLPAGTPEEGRYVVTGFNAPASHAMTIVGYNDSIRYDYNNDGRYTNDEDINNDGIVDVRDWEIGGFKFVNSYGLVGSSTFDSGFCYMMYRTLAEKYGSGGIWNNSVSVLKVKPDYSPTLTMRVKLKHTCRNSIRVRAGVSADPDSYEPEQIMDFPIFNFQGGVFPMQGLGSDTNYSIEFGLDITPLLSYVQNNKNAAYFLLVDENDPYSQYGGSIESFSVIDYSTSPPHSTEYQHTPLELSNNDLTLAKVETSTNVDKVHINSTGLPLLTPGQPYSAQLSASGGEPPYNWSIDYDYTKLQDNRPLPDFVGTKLISQHPTDSITAVVPGFSFPFYGKTYDTVYVNMNDGFLQFTTDNIPWPYLTEENILLRSYKMIVPFSNSLLKAADNNEGAWYHINSASISFRWKLSKKIGETYFPYEMQATLSADGTITFYHNNIAVAANEIFHSGISNGDKENFDLSSYHKEFDANQFNYVKYVPDNYPKNLKISKTGLIDCLPLPNQTTCSIPCKVTDYNNVFDKQTFQLTTGILAGLRIHAGNDSIIIAGENVKADLVLTNLTGNDFNNLTATLHIGDSFISLIDSTQTIPALTANGKLIIADAFSFGTLPQVADKHTFLMDLKVSNSSSEWKQTISDKILAPSLNIVELKSNKPGGALLQPGEQGTIVCTTANIGHAAAENASASIQINDPRIKILSGETVSFGTFSPGQKTSAEFLISIPDSILLGTRIPVIITLLLSDQSVQTDTLSFRIGKAPVLVIDLDVNKISAPVILQQIKDLGYIAEYENFIAPDINEYQSLFVNLGKYSDRHNLTYIEGDVLSNYLEQGGNIYLESPNFWRDDVVTSLNPRFNIQTVNKAHKYDTLSGSTGAFAENLDFFNRAFPLSNYYLKPLGSAFSLFEDEGFTCCVANNNGSYKTIGNLFEFASIEGVDFESTKEKLMKKYLDFFGVKQDVIGINEQQIKLQAGTVDVYPNPASDKVYLTYLQNDVSSAITTVIDMNGNVVVELKDKNGVAKATHTLEWDLNNKSGRRVSPGLYICRVVAKSEVKLGKIMVK